MKLEVFRTDFYENPFEEWCEMPTFYNFHRSFRVAKTDIEATGDYSSAYEELIEELGQDIYFCPVYMYDHGGRTVKTTPFSCHWDSGLAGYFFYTEAEAREMYPGTEGSELFKRVQELLEIQVKLLDNILTGEVYEFRVIDDAGNIVDSCSGFYGDCAEDIAYYAEAPIEKVTEAMDTGNAVFW